MRILGKHGENNRPHKPRRCGVERLVRTEGLPEEDAGAGTTDVPAWRTVN
jgi:hypothetical protein